MENGMSQVSVNDMLVDDEGFVWIGTADGLNRFDGNFFKHFKHDVNNFNSISGNYITNIAKGINGELYVGTRGNGLNVYNAAKNTFKKILFNDSGNETISGIVTNKNGDIFISTLKKGLHKINPYDNYHIETLLTRNNITAIESDKEGVLWVGGLDGKVYGYYNNFDSPLIEFKVDGNVQTFFRSRNYLFVGSYEGFFVYDFRTKEVRMIELEVSGNFKTMHVVDFLKEDESRVWIASGRGLYLFDYLNFQVLEKIEYKEELGNGLSNNTVQSLHKIAPNLLYVGTANQLNCLDFNKPVFRNISKNKKGDKILNDNVIFSIYKDENLWIGTSDGGLNLITKDSTYYYIDNKNDKGSIVGSVVRAIVHDSINNRMWFATTRGLSLLNLKDFNPEKHNFKNFYHNPNDSNSINSNFLKDLVLDGNNNLWGGTHEHGVFRLEYNNDNSYKFTRYKSDPNNANTLINNETNCIEIDKNKNIWVGTQHGVSKIQFDKNYKEISFANYGYNETPPQTLPHNSVNDILIDEKDRIWFGTRAGLGMLDNDNSFSTWGKDDQFPNDLIYSIQDDLNGNLWIGTNHGLVKFDTHKQKFSHFSEQDNIQGREFDTHARFRDLQGNIYMGGVDGVTYFNPNKIDRLDASKPMYFFQLQVKDKVIEIDNGENILYEVIEKTPIINIDYTQFPLSLKFSTKDFRFDKNIEFAYRLSPLDKEWNFLNNNTVQFLTLPSGEYNLEISGFSRGGKWEQPPLNLKIKVNPPWWNSNLAIFGYILTIALLAYWFYKFQLSRKLALAESRRLKEIDRLKDSLYTNITHEFRTPLTVILGMADEIESKFENFNTNERKPLNLIKRNASILLKMVNNMLDLSKLENTEIQLNLVQDNVIDFIKYVFESYESLANEKQIKYTFYSELDILIMDFDSEKLSTVLTNLLTNAIKFTPIKGQVVCHIKRTENKAFHLKIVDTGVGISKKNLIKIFKKFYRVNPDDHGQMGGTGIGLALVKELIELMGGTIEVKSNERQGSEFYIKLPITNTAKRRDSLKQGFNKRNKLDLEFNKNNLSLVDFDKSLIALIIEDNKDVAYYLKTCLEDKYQILCAEDGKEGFSLAKQFIPDIVISDVMMPKMDGYEVCKAIKNNLITNHIPVILLTAKSTDKDKIEGLSHGADAFLVKPFNKEELFTRIDQLVSIRKKMIAKFSKEEFKEFISKKDEFPETVFIKQIVEIVSNALDDPNFGSSELASKMHLSESQLYRKIKATTNRSTSVFIRSIRLNRSKLLLQSNNKSISEVAYKVGFNDPSWFSRAFKDEFGKSPSEFTKDLFK